MSRRNKKNQPPVVVGARTDVGCVRSQNEDSMLVKFPLLVVADGIGGQEAGEVASQIAIETLDDEAPRFVDAEALGEAVVSANRAVMTAVERGRGRPGMGTTCTAAIIEDDKMAVAQVGDSRVYRLRNGALEQLTNDHSLIAAMLESGQITPDEAKNHPSRSIITRALGSDPEMIPDLFEFDLVKGDRIVLCSDGLHGLITDVQIRDVLNNNPDAQAAADALVEAAKKAGGSDNVTVIVANIDRALPSPETVEHKSRKLGVILFTAIAIALVAAAVGGFLFYVRSSAFLISQDGQVAVYSGRIGNFAGLKLQWYEYTSDIKTDQLPDITVTKLGDGIQFESLEDAEAALVDYENQIKETEQQKALEKAEKEAAKEKAAAEKKAAEEKAAAEKAAAEAAAAQQAAAQEAQEG